MNKKTFIECSLLLHLINDKIKITQDPRSHPARLKTAGSVSAPVPTIKLNI